MRCVVCKNKIADDDDIFPDGNRERERMREQSSVCLRSKERQDCR